ncbi:MAG: [acyl-carrier-protein] S-malonyltransferase [Alphaproteobacteria bacterium CG_4_10_14_0_2_um_filter_63_37]|nr:MAG: [acyl-carrier-protein] S-malonyltransferase [Proteobacteria bacterium CG1_02_64_396]PJA25276.1 MAG: [acyl-carrier-protein] S-malonyltransferase [Alphaproteobacteria bacterium CG_4_10_14_0_2_um_filter_63_37]
MGIAFTFPGQGSQAVGMGKAFYDLGGDFKAIFQMADDTLGYSLTKLMFEGPEENLRLTANTQPALVTMAAAAHLALTQAGIAPTLVAGHSLGEYAAVAAAGGLSWSDAIRLVHIRGKAMQEAVPVGQGGMAAILGVEMAVVRQLCEQVSQNGLIVVPANDNAPGQIVISGHNAAVAAAVEAAKEVGGKRSVILPVSAPFHSPLMAPAAEVMRKALTATGVADLSVPVVANVTADAVRSGAAELDLLVEQVTAPVRWVESVQRMKALGATLLVEPGSGKVLTGMLKRIDKELTGAAVNGPEDIDKLQAQLA